MRRRRMMLGDGQSESITTATRSFRASAARRPSNRLLKETRMSCPNRSLFGDEKRHRPWGNAVAALLASFVVSMAAAASCAVPSASAHVIWKADAELSMASEWASNSGEFVDSMGKVAAASRPQPNLPELRSGSRVALLPLRATRR